MSRSVHLPDTKGLKTKRLITWLVLLWEAFWLSATPAVGVVGIAVAIALLEVPQKLGTWFGGWFHATILAVVLASFFWALGYAVVKFRPPNSNAINRRLEASSGLEHRPLTALSDNLENSADHRTRRLWDAHHRRVLVTLRKLKVGPPQPILSTLDRFAIRAPIGIALIIGVVVAWTNPLERLTAAVTPSFSIPESPAGTNLDVWISPPGYTGRPPFLLSRKTQIDAPATTLDVITVPATSTVLAAVTGGTSEPVLAIETTTAGIKTLGFETIGPRSYRLKAELRDCVRLSVRRNQTEMASWTLNIVPDLPPEITFKENPTRTQRDSLLIRYEARDDHGVAKAEALITLLDEQGEDAGEERIIIPMSLPPSHKGNANGHSLANLTPHPWAGHPVGIRLRATDKINQNGFSESIKMILPERVFHHPVARAVIEQRKRLIFHGTQRQNIASMIMAIAASPQSYEHDLVAFIVLKSAALRLGLNGDGSEDASVIDLLWGTALRIEDGELSLAAQRLRELQKQLQKALAGNASNDQIEKLMGQLRAAIDKYLEAMVKLAQTTAGQQRSEDIRQFPQENELRHQDLRNLVDQTQMMVEGGARDAAREMLSRIQQIMENMRVGQRHASPQQRALQTMMRQLNELTRRQQELLDKTFQRQQHQQQGNQHRQGGNSRGLKSYRQGHATEFGNGLQKKWNSGPSKFELSRPSDPDKFSQMSPKELAQMQEQLRRALSAFIRELSESINGTHNGFGRAERSMRKAAGALKKDQPRDATGPQTDAIGQMREGGQVLSDMLREQHTNGRDRPNQQVFGIHRSRKLDHDPLNRRRDGRGNYDQTTIDIPEASAIQKARQIFDELRQRSNDRSRPALELEYINRLLRRF